MTGEGEGNEERSRSNSIGNACYAGYLLAGYMITVGDFQSDCRKCNPIKSSKVNGDGKKHRSMPEVWSNAFIK